MPTSSTPSIPDYLNALNANAAGANAIPTGYTLLYRPVGRIEPKE